MQSLKMVGVFELSSNFAQSPINETNTPRKFRYSSSMGLTLIWSRPADLISHALIDADRNENSIVRN